MHFFKRGYKTIKKYVHRYKQRDQQAHKKPSFLGWLIQVLFLFLIIKFLLYPGVGLLLGTPQPIVAVISGSMEHTGDLEVWWTGQQTFYQEYNITQQDFEDFPQENGLNQGDLIVLKKPKDLKIGDIIVFENIEKEGQIIHRIIAIQDGTYTTKGDNNRGLLTQEQNIVSERIIGKSVFRVPYLGNIRVITSQIIRSVI